MTHLPALLSGFCLIVYAVGGTGFAGAAAQAPRAEARVSAIDVPRPMSLAVRQVERHFGRVVTYEDVSYVAPSDIVDITEQVRRDGRLGERVYGMRNGSISLSHLPSASATEAEVEKVLALLVAKWNASGQSGQFRIATVDGGYHVIPVARKGVGENVEPYSSPLDTRITLPSEERDGLETVAAVAQAISSSSGRQVTPGTMPMNALGRARIVVGAQDQTARDILWKALQAVDRSLSWQVLCGVGEDAMCAINIHRARKE